MHSISVSSLNAGFADVKWAHNHSRSLTELKAPGRDLPSWQQKASPLQPGSTSTSQQSAIKQPSTDGSPSPMRLEERIDAARLQAAQDKSPAITLDSSPADIEAEQLGTNALAANLLLHNPVSEGDRQTHREVQVIPGAGKQLQQDDQPQITAQAEQDLKVIPDAGHQLQAGAGVSQPLQQQAGTQLPGLSSDEALQSAMSDKTAAGADALSSPASKRQLGQQRMDAEGVEIKVDSIGTLTVLAMTLGMAGVSAIGALPFFFVGSLSKEWTGLANAIACGVMLAASFDLVHEGQPYGGHLVILGVVIGEESCSRHKCSGTWPWRPCLDAFSKSTCHSSVPLGSSRSATQ